MHIIQYPNEILRTKVKQITEINQEIITLSQDMILTMNQASGVGLAGPQVNKDLAIFVVKPSKEADAMVFINPTILSKSLETSIYEEGCLSLPKIYHDVSRSQALEMQYYNEKGKLFKQEFDGFLARVIFHEYDHLQGVLFFDHLKPHQQKKILKKYEKLKNKN